MYKAEKTISSSPVEAKASWMHYAHTCVYTCSCEWLHRGICAGGGQRLTFDGFLYGLVFWGRISHWTWSSLIVLIGLTRWVVTQRVCIFPSSVWGLLRSMASINVGSKSPSVGHLVLHIHWLSHLPITCFCKMGVSVRVSEVYCCPLFMESLELRGPGDPFKSSLLGNISEVA